MSSTPYVGAGAAARSTWLAARGIPETFDDRPHGTRIRYRGGCRCAECREGNRIYAKGRRLAIARGGWDGYVDAGRARAHLLALGRRGLGRRAVHDASDVALSVLGLIRTGKRRRIRASTERAILGVDVDAIADHATVPAGPTWRRLDALIAEGYTKAELALRLGAKTPALQLRRGRVLARTAARVERLFVRLMGEDLDGREAGA